MSQLFYFCCFTFLPFTFLSFWISYCTWSLSVLACIYCISVTRYVSIVKLNELNVCRKKGIGFHWYMFIHRWYIYMSNSYIILGLNRLNYTAIQIELVYISLHAYRSRCGVEVMGNMDCVYLYLGLVKWGGLCCLEACELWRKLLHYLAMPWFWPC